MNYKVFPIQRLCIRCKCRKEVRGGRTMASGFVCSACRTDSKTPNGREWTEAEKNYAIRNIGPKTAEEIGVVVNRSPEAVRRFIKRYDDERLGR